MVKTRLYESEEDEIIKLIDKNIYDVIILDNRPQDVQSNKYRVILTKKKNENDWLLRIFIKPRLENSMWQPTPGKWYLKYLLERGFDAEDSISIDGGSSWKVGGMIDIIEEAIYQTEEFDERELDVPDDYFQEEDELRKQHQERHFDDEPLETKYIENKNKDYSKMNKFELEKVVNQALDDNDYELLAKIQKYLPETVNIPFAHKHVLNEKLAGPKNQERFIDLRGPSGNAFAILGMAAQLTKQLEEVNPGEYNWERIQSEMKSSDYKNLVLTFEKYFGDYVTIYNSDVIEETEGESIDEAIKHLKPRSKGEILRNMKNDKRLKRRRRPTNESLNEKKEILMGHNSSNPDDPIVNGLAFRIETEEDIEDQLENVDENFIMKPFFKEEHICNEGCGCGGKKPKGKVTPIPARPKQK